MFHHQIKHFVVCQKYSAARRIFKFLLGVSSGDGTLRLMLNILSEDDMNGGNTNFKDLIVAVVKYEKSM